MGVQDTLEWRGDGQLVADRHRGAAAVFTPARFGEDCYLAVKPVDKQI
jgi:hypothetical protein